MHLLGVYTQKNVENILSLIQKSKRASEVVATYDQNKIDLIVRMFGKVVYDNAEPLAKMAVEETRMGVFENKIMKNIGKSRIIWNHLKGKKSIGVLEVDEASGLTKVAKPMGVVAAVTPCTNPIVTPMANAMFALKGGNTIIIAPHPRATKCALEIKRLYDIELEKMDVPTDCFLVVDEPSIEKTGFLMKNCDVVIATGGMGMVKSAYSSGKPSFGVGAGNVQGIYDENIDIPTSVTKAITSRTFDNGIICSGDQTVIAPASTYKQIIDEFVKQGAYYTEDADEVGKIEQALFPGGVMNKDLV